MNYTIITACYEFIYMYRDPWRTGTWSRTDTLPGRSAWTPDAAWTGTGTRPLTPALAPDTGNPAGARPPAPTGSPF
jgi:hypothetical protein